MTIEERQRPSKTLSREHVTLTVVNLLGRWVAVLIDGAMPAGSHQVRFDAGRLAGGVYLYGLHAGGYSQARMAWFQVQTGKNPANFHEGKAGVRWIFCVSVLILEST